MFTDDSVARLEGFRFPGGTYTIQRWENFLLTDCTGRVLLADGLVHPIALFHVSILGVGISITELFSIGQVESADSVGLDGYDWEYFQPLRQDIEYRFEGGINSAERRFDPKGRPFDAVSFSIELFEGNGEIAARVTNFLRFRR